MISTRSVVGFVTLSTLAVALGAAPRAHADPVEVSGGKVTLALTGLVVDLPKDARKEAVWSLAGSWSFTDGGVAFDARDVIDQKVAGKLVGGSWVHVGYFNAGGCDAVVKELDVADRWTAEADLWGRHWSVAGGTWDFANDLGKAPVVALCSPQPNRASLLLYHFFIGDPARDQAALIEAVGKQTVLRRVTEAWAAGRIAPVLSLKRPELKMRGTIAAARTVHLSKSGFDVALPDDGYAWLARAPEADVTSDFLDRMAPALPDVSLEVARAPGTECSAVFPTGEDAPKYKKESAPRGIPSGWKSLGTLIMDTEPGEKEPRLERIVCRDAGGTALVVGLIAMPTGAAETRDFGSFTALFEALAKGSDAAP